MAQCISPGVVETQFAFKLHDKDPEKAAATYEHMKVGPSEATHSLTEGEGALAFRPCPSSQPVASPGLGEHGCWRGPPWWGEDLGSFCLRLTPFPPCSQCLKPEDVAEAVIYVLSTPPHVQVSLALAVCPLEEPSQPRGREWGGLKRVGRASRLPQALCLLQIGDIQMRPTEQVT